MSLTIDPTVPPSNPNQTIFEPVKPPRSLVPLSNAATAPIHESDVVTYHWASRGSGNGNGDTAFVQDGSLSFGFGRPTAGNPPTPYPFTRLAWLNDTNSSATYIYHQLDSETLIEDAYFLTTGWHSTNITIGTNR